MRLRMETLADFGSGFAFSNSSVFLFLLPLGLPGLRFGAFGMSAIAASRSKVFLFLLPLGRLGFRFGFSGSLDFGLGGRPRRGGVS